MKQNIYDDEIFFEGYSELRRNNKGYNEYLEEPAIDALLPNLKKLDVLDIGCGFGFFSTKVIEKGARSYLGIDISQKMLSKAKRLENEKVKFVNSSIEDFDYHEQKYDLVVSSVCLHYVENIDNILKKIFKSLKPNGEFIFSVEHPICTSLLKGWHTNESKIHWPVDNYFDESKRYQNWFTDNVVKYHRTTETYVGSIIRAGFTLSNLLEPSPSKDDMRLREDLIDHYRRPALLVIKARKTVKNANSADAKSRAAD